MKIKPLIKKNLDYLFVGINPVNKSVIGKRYEYFKSNSHFYSILNDIGLTKGKKNSNTILDSNIGIVNYFSNLFGKYQLASEEDKSLAKFMLINYICDYKPKKIVFLSKYLIKDFFVFPKRNITYGKIGDFLGVPLYVVPFPTMPMRKDKKLAWYKKIK